MVNIDYVSDVLCVWAWASEGRIENLQQEWGGNIHLTPRFINLFGDTQTRIGEGWKEKGGFEGFAQHTSDVAKMFPELNLNAKVWQEVQPASSLPAHLYLKAVQLVTQDDKAAMQAAKYIRHAFFAEGKDIGSSDVIEMVLAALDFDLDKIKNKLQTGEAHQALWADQLEREKQQLKGSPSYILDGGRQILFGNVSQPILDANIRELVEFDLKAGISLC